MHEIGIIIAEMILKEFQNEKKATYYHVSSNNRRYSWINMIDEDKAMGIRLLANNNTLESPFSRLTN